MYPSVRKNSPEVARFQDLSCHEVATDESAVDSDPPESSAEIRLPGIVGRVTLITPLRASLPYKLDPPPRKTSMELTSSRGMRPQYTHPPNGSLRGISS